MSGSVHGVLRGIQHSPNPVFVTDEANRITAWNGTMVRLLGYRADQAVGSACHALIAGTDIFGNIFCDRNCNVRKMIRRNQIVKRFDMDLKHASGHVIRAHCSVLVVPERSASRLYIIHLLEKVEERMPRRTSRERIFDARSSRPSQSAGIPGVQLTPREQQILRLLATGAGTQEIAAFLSISATTVRTHVRNLLQKLRAHSRIEAVMRALREQLI